MNLTERKNVYPLWIVIELDYEMFRNFRPHINVIESIINPLGEKAKKKNHVKKEYVFCCHPKSKD